MPGWSVPGRPVRVVAVAVAAQQADGGAQLIERLTRVTADPVQDGGGLGVAPRRVLGDARLGCSLAPRGYRCVPAVFLAWSPAPDWSGAG